MAYFYYMQCDKKLSEIFRVGGQFCVVEENAMVYAAFWTVFPVMLYVL